MDANLFPLFLGAEEMVRQRCASLDELEGMGQKLRDECAVSGKILDVVDGLAFRSKSVAGTELKKCPNGMLGIFRVPNVDGITGQEAGFVCFAEFCDAAPEACSPACPLHADQFAVMMKERRKVKATTALESASKRHAPTAKSVQGPSSAAVITSNLPALPFKKHFLKH